MDGSYLIITLTGFYKVEKCYEIQNHKDCCKTQSCGQNLQSIKHSNFQLEAGAYNRRKKNWHFKREGAIGFAALLWKSGASLKCSIKTKGRTAVKIFLFSLHNGVKYFIVALLFSNCCYFSKKFYSIFRSFRNFSQKMSHCIY